LRIKRAWRRAVAGDFFCRMFSVLSVSNQVALSGCVSIRRATRRLSGNINEPAEISAL
jgi:hypothetical protein